MNQSTTRLIANNIKKELTSRKDFMDFFRDDEKLNLLSVDDRLEIFSHILLGESDFTKEFLEEVFGNYGVTHLKITETANAKK